MHDIETENQKLRETLEEYNKEFAEVKNQGRLQPYYQLLMHTEIWRQRLNSVLFLRGGGDSSIEIQSRKYNSLLEALLYLSVEIWLWADSLDFFESFIYCSTKSEDGVVILHIWL